MQPLAMALQPFAYMQPFASSMRAMQPVASSGGSSGVRAAKSTSVEAKLCLVCRVRVQNKLTLPQRMCVSCARSAGYEPRTQKRKLCSVCNQKQSRRDTPNKFCKSCTQKVDGQKVPHQHKLCEADGCQKEALYGYELNPRMFCKAHRSRQEDTDGVAMHVYACIVCRVRRRPAGGTICEGCSVGAPCLPVRKVTGGSFPATWAAIPGALRLDDRIRGKTHASLLMGKPTQKPHGHNGLKVGQQWIDKTDMHESGAWLASPGTGIEYCTETGIAVRPTHAPTEIMPQS
jgi:hypothetical protein